jgi:hypothetical protein
MSKIRHAAPTADVIHAIVFGGLITLVGFVTYLRV